MIDTNGDGAAFPASGDRAFSPDRLRLIFESLYRCDLEAFLEPFDPDLEFELVLPQRVNRSLGQKGFGRRAFLEALNLQFSNFEFFDYDIIEIHADEHAAVVRRKVFARNIGAGNPKSLELCSILSFRNGKICKLVEYADTYVLSQLLQPGDDDVLH